MRAQNYIPPFSHRGEEKTHSFKAVGFFDNAGTKREERLVACSIFGWVDRMINMPYLWQQWPFSWALFFSQQLFWPEQKRLKQQEPPRLRGLSQKRILRSPKQSKP